MQWKVKANSAGKDWGRSCNPPAFNNVHHRLYTNPFSTHGITFVNFRDVTVAWSVLLAECIALMQNLSFWAAPRNSLKTLQILLLGTSGAAPGEYLQGPSEERALSSPPLLNKEGLVHALVYLGLGTDFTCLFYSLSANYLPLSVWNQYKVNRVRYHMLIPVCFLADKSEKYKLFVRLLHINTLRQLHG